MAVNSCKSVKPPRTVRHDIPTFGPDELLRLIIVIKETNYYIYFQPYYIQAYVEASY